MIEMVVMVLGLFNWLITVLCHEILLIDGFVNEGYSSTNILMSIMLSVKIHNYRLCK
jgi:hypothetical protein